MIRYDIRPDEVRVVLDAVREMGIQIRSTSERYQAAGRAVERSLDSATEVREALTSTFESVAEVGHWLAASLEIKREGVQTAVEAFAAADATMAAAGLAAASGITLTDQP